jgi:hypothetical protein
LRATGVAATPAGRLRFVLTAARPARVRLETENAGRTLVQGTDGKEAPWEFDTGTWPPKYRAMADAAAKTFMADAEFDDPLIGGEARGFGFDFAGEMDVEGRKLFRILVTRKLTDTYSLLLDSDTYLIVMRVEHWPTVSGRKVQVVTHYEDFRPVNGVLLPHEITMVVDGKATQQTKITRIEANPEIKPDTFTRPNPPGATAAGKS